MNMCPHYGLHVTICTALNHYNEAVISFTAGEMDAVIVHMRAAVSANKAYYLERQQQQALAERETSTLKVN